VVALLASISGIVVVGVLKVTPAFAGNTCGWMTQMAMQDATGSCRSGYVFDPGFDQLMTRQELVSNAALYTSDGFSNNFLWYAPQTKLTLSPTQNNTLQWSECVVSGTEYLDSGNGTTACPSSSDVVPPPASHTIDDWDFNDATVTLDTWTWGQSSIFLVCGNPISPAPPSTPVPTITGSKFDDLNKNGVQDSGEPGIPNWPMTLTRVTSDFNDQPTGGVVATTTTDSNGNFSFALNGEGPGTYSVTEGSEPGWTNTTGGTTEDVTVNPGIGNATLSVPPFGNSPGKMTTLKEKVNPKIVASGKGVTFTYLEKNIGSDPITGVTVSGSLCGPATFESSSDGNDTTLDPGATWKFMCTTVLTNTGGEVNKVETDNATANGMDALFKVPAPTEYASARVTVSPGCLSLDVNPNPLVETGASEVHGVIQVEACATFAGDKVNIDSSQLDASCRGGITFENLQNGGTTATSNTNPHRIDAVLDDDGNATVVVDGTDCAPGTDVVEADLEVAPFYTALTRLRVLPPAVTPVGVTGYPQIAGISQEVETGDTSSSGESNIYAVFYVEENPVYAEQTVEIDSAQLEGRCVLGWRWEPGNANGIGVGPGYSGPQNGVGVNTGTRPSTILDDDGNAVFVFKGTSCASGPSEVIADVLAGTGDTFTTTFTVDPPAPTI
jgi:hypothetical protein